MTFLNETNDRTICGIKGTTLYDRIIRSTVRLDNNPFSPQFKSDGIRAICKCAFNEYINPFTHIYRNQYDFYYRTLSNYYFSQPSCLNDREMFISLFARIQRTYFVLHRFAFYVAKRRAKRVVQTDLQMNLISENEPRVLCVYQTGANYLFKIEELLKWVYMGLTHTYIFFNEPISIKNPYNNIPFSKSILYFMYTYLRENSVLNAVRAEHVDLFMRWTSLNFHLSEMVRRYEWLLREYAIQNYVANSTLPQLKTDIMKMIDDYNSVHIFNQIIIDADFPANKLVSIMTPYLDLYLKSQFSLISKTRTAAGLKLQKKLKDFQLYNPIFGFKTTDTHMCTRFSYATNPREQDYIYEGFNCFHRPFYSRDHGRFMTDHLTVEYTEEDAMYEERDVLPPLNYYGRRRHLQTIHNHTIRGGIITQPLNNDEYNTTDDETEDDASAETSHNAQ